MISPGLGLLVAGETEFDLAGFVMVMVASALSGLRWTITQVLLQGSEAHGAAPVPVLPRPAVQQTFFEEFWRTTGVQAQNCLPVLWPWCIR